ncbi:hypothetical protein [Streptomyces jumonjinensis]|uniref:Uncharacterized protein n=1 Tax=Streptomyces jumonjinensis TaxID=1945 RepID=A0A646KTK5_STRJU|nr:hypothetical protein [Streptomyces jumonjinensis]MQT04346.1 hypothetical protein [Streptomyces jumonjinensis]
MASIRVFIRTALALSALLTWAFLAGPAMADTPHRAPGAERLWLLGGLALTLAAAGAVAFAATRGRRGG